MAQAAQGQNVDFQQVLFVGPLMGQKRPVGAQAGAVDQQVDTPFAFFQFQYEARQAQRLAEVAGAEQHLDTKALGQLDGHGFQRFPLTCHQDQVAPAPCQRFRQGQAQAAGSTSDHGVTGHARLLGAEEGA
ncbi:hypothetical protein D3C76_977700 [compost metagenome]